MASIPLIFADINKKHFVAKCRLCCQFSSCLAFSAFFHKVGVCCLNSHSFIV